MSDIANPRRLEAALIAHGLVPPNARLLEVVIAPMQVTMLRYEVFVSEDDLRRLSAAFLDAWAGRDVGDDVTDPPGPI